MEWHSATARTKVFFDNLTHDSDRSVGFPLYRIITGITIIPALLQLAYLRVPDAVVEVTPQWYHFVFIGMQIAGTLAILVALAIGDTPDSAILELVGAIVIGGMSFIYFGISWRYDGWGPPLAVATWMQFGFAIFCIVRVFQLNRKLEKFKKRVAEIQAEETS
ncbi:membrane protein [Gordonia phage LilyPad]|nr:membrane protein [Gordonia phage LilyPad]